VIVTHDPDEALRIADRIVLLDRGRLVQAGAPEELYCRPRTLFAAQFFSDVAALPGTCSHGCVETPLGRFRAPLEDGCGAIACVRPEHLKLAAAPTAIAGRVVSSEFRGDSRYLLVAVEGVAAPLVLRAPPRSSIESGAPASGMPVYLEIDAKDVPVVALTPQKESFHARQQAS
jgi:iron(III) transport system ATP-binding protein